MSSTPFKFTRSLGFDAEGDFWDSCPEASEFYEHEYLEMNPSIHQEDAEAKYSVVLRFLEGVFAERQISTLGDLGCGGCFVIKRVLDHLGNRSRGLGIDLSSSVLKRCEADARLTKMRARAEDVPVGDSSLDLLLCLDIVEHVDDPNALLREARRIAKLAIFKVPIELSVYTLLRGGPYRLRHLKRKFGHVHHFTYPKLRKAVERHFHIVDEGFEIIPGRSFLTHQLQVLMLRLGLERLYAFTFGGFAIMATCSRVESETGGTYD